MYIYKRPLRSSDAVVAAHFSLVNHPLLQVSQKQRNKALTLAHAQTINYTSQIYLYLSLSNDAIVAAHFALVNHRLLQVSHGSMDTYRYLYISISNYICICI